MHPPFPLFVNNALCLHFLMCTTEHESLHSNCFKYQWVGITHM